MNEDNLTKDGNVLIEQSKDGRFEYSAERIKRLQKQYLKNKKFEIWHKIFILLVAGGFFEWSISDMNSTRDRDFLFFIAFIFKFWGAIITAFWVWNLSHSAKLYKEFVRAEYREERK